VWRWEHLARDKEQGELMSDVRAVVHEGSLCNPLRLAAWI